MALKFKENIVGYHREFEKNLDLRLPENLKVNINLIPEKNLKTTLPWVTKFKPAVKMQTQSTTALNSISHTSIDFIILVLR